MDYNKGNVTISGTSSEDVPQVMDPRILAESYLVYKTGKLI